MIRSSKFAGDKVGVFGLGRSGLAAVRSLEEGGASVFAWDDHLVSNINPNIPLENLYKTSFEGYKGLVLAPGVPLTHPAPHPLVEKAKAMDVDIFGDIELFGRARPCLPSHKVVGITGTNGKSTTTALLAHVLESCDVPSMASGNIGLPVLEQDPLPEGGVYVFELSSFQLDLTESLCPEISIFLNITPDHLNRHGDMAGYIKAKSRLFEMQDKKGVVILNVDDPILNGLRSKIEQKIVSISTKDVVENGFFIKDGHVFENFASTPHDLGPLPSNPNLRGEHNWQNLLTVVATTRELGLEPKDIMKGLRSFSGLRHRMELVLEHGGVTFINDSKATNSAATSKALNAFEDVYWIAGGEFKEESLELLEPCLSNIKKAYFIGRDAELFEELAKGNVEYSLPTSLDKAMDEAFADATNAKGGVILMSPACASYDQFESYRDRGEIFKALAHKLTGGTSA